MVGFLGVASRASLLGLTFTVAADILISLILAVLLCRIVPEMSTYSPGVVVV